MVIEQQNGPEAIFVAGGAGAATGEMNYHQASLHRNSIGNERTGSSGIQRFISFNRKNVYCAGAGFSESPNVGALMIGSVPPQTYAQGLRGGQGQSQDGDLREGGFGGGGACYYKNACWYFGAGGGFTGGSTRVRDVFNCDGGGGGSFSIDEDAAFDHFFVEYGKCKIEFIK